MTDINKHIEEEAREYRDREFQERIVRANSNFDSVDIEMAFRNGYKSCLHSSRWRKVSEGELPDLLEEVIVEDANGRIQKGHRYEAKKDTVFWSTDFTTFYNIVRWKPID